MKKKIIGSIAVLSGLLSALPAWAIQNPATGFFVSLPNNTPQGIIMFAIQRILLPLSGTVALLFIIIGGYQYITSGINEEMAESGKKTLQNAIIGLIIVILSYLIVTVVINQLFSLN
jgi:hypothetical protein